MWRVRGITPCNSSSPFKAVSACLSFSSLERQIASAKSHILRAAVAVTVSLRAICRTAKCPSKPSSKTQNSLNYPDCDFRVMSCSVFPPGTSENLKPSNPSLMPAQLILHAAITYWVLISPQVLCRGFYMWNLTLSSQHTSSQEMFGGQQPGKQISILLSLH